MTAKQTQALIALAGSYDLARLSLHGDRLIERRAPLLSMGLTKIVPPAGGFLQATAKGEETLAALVAQCVGDARAVLDLFAGCGPFALRLAEKMRIHAVEIQQAPLDALMHAAKAMSGLKPIAVEARDLFRRPYLAHELTSFDAVIFDPPRAGAEAQARALAAARNLRAIVAVSCDPATFARDARFLVDGGYRVEQVTPIDQFRYSAHVELVALFQRGRRNA